VQNCFPEQTEWKWCAMVTSLLRDAWLVAPSWHRHNVSTRARTRRFHAKRKISLPYQTLSRNVWLACATLTIELMGLFRKPGLYVRQLKNKNFSCRREAVRMCSQQLALTMQYTSSALLVYILLVILALDLLMCTNKFCFGLQSTNIDLNEDACCMLSTYTTVAICWQQSTFQ